MRPLRFFTLSVLVTFGVLQPLIAQEVHEVIRQNLVEFDTVSDFRPLFDEIENRHLVLMGEATHGTSEFYTWRAELSKHLIKEKGFRFIAVEGDWPALSRINAFVKQKPGAPETIDEAMASIDRWPLWMWRNQEVKELVEWLAEYNLDRPEEERAGFYGIDLYAEQQAMLDVVSWFESYDSDLADRAERTYRCLSRASGLQSYLNRVARTGDDCSAEVEQVLEQVREFGAERGIENDWDYFNAEQNAILVVNAEKHIRANLSGGPDSWNYRASHFELTSRRLLDFYGEDARGIVWAHNTHIGDARATEMGRQGAVNIGQLSREHWGYDLVYAIGFGTYRGDVFAATRWEGARQEMQIPEAVDGSWEKMLQETEVDRFYLLFSVSGLQQALNNNIPHRAIGVTYMPHQDRGNYVNTVLPDRYDAFIFISETGLLDPLD